MTSRSIVVEGAMGFHLPSANGAVNSKGFHLDSKEESTIEAKSNRKSIANGAEGDN